MVFSLTAVPKTPSPNSAASSDRDAGFCSGSSDIGDDFHHRDSNSNPQSPTTDASENSVDVKLTAISIPSKNKRKTLEPTRVIHESDYPLKKRHRFEFAQLNANSHVPTPPILISPIPSECSGNEGSTGTNKAIDLANPFRPWASVVDGPADPAKDVYRHPATTTQHRADTDAQPDQQDQPLALIKKRQTQQPSNNNPCSVSSNSDRDKRRELRPTPFHFPAAPALDFQFNDETSQPLVPSDGIRSDADNHTPTLDLSKPNGSSSRHPDRSSNSDNLVKAIQTLQRLQEDQDEQDEQCESESASPDNQQHSHRNYKNMTRERRIEANARERTRVHTISAAFDTLRKSVPSYAQSQKLSKLSVLRVACSYILTLSRIAGDDYSADGSEPSVNECADEVTRTIQTEGKVRKKKDD